jgi:hypothetical protein
MSCYFGRLPLAKCALCLGHLLSQTPKLPSAVGAREHIVDEPDDLITRLNAVHGLSPRSRCDASRSDSAEPVAHIRRVCAGSRNGAWSLLALVEGAQGLQNLRRCLRPVYFPVL